MSILIQYYCKYMKPSVDIIAGVLYCNLIELSYYLF